ncbi:MAG TPA: hypothetical protein VGF50_02530 [Caulobacteraceae bacterium]
MIFRRLLFLLAGAVALAVAAGVVVVALAYALYALVSPYVGRAGAAAIVAAAAAVLIGLLGFLLTRQGKRRPSSARKPGEGETITDRIFDFVRAKPVTTVAGAVAAGILAVRNPGYLGSLLRAFVEGREHPRGRRR